MKIIKTNKSKRGIQNDDNYKKKHRQTKQYS